MLARLRQGWLRRKLGQPVIVVSGLPRSGTSMMMKMLGAAGFDIVTDKIRTADEDNPKGYFELEQVKELDKNPDKEWVAGHKGKVLKVISFLLKDLPDDCYYKVIFMRRDLHEVIASQNKMLVRRGEPTDTTKDERMIELYQTHLRKTAVLLESRPNFESLDVDYRAVLERPLEGAEAVARFLGDGVDARAMAATVDPELYRNRREALG